MNLKDLVSETEPSIAKLNPGTLTDRDILWGLLRLMAVMLGLIAAGRVILDLLPLAGT